MQFAFGHRLRPVLDQEEQQVEGLGRQVHLLTVAHEPARADIQREGIELVGHTVDSFLIGALDEQPRQQLIHGDEVVGEGQRPA
jgi:hypothetical protein